MEYRVILKYLFYNNDRSCHLSAKKEITLPFVPYIGLSIEEGDMYPIYFKSVNWLIDENCFYCNVEEDGENEFEIDDDIEELKEIFDTLRDAEKNGWIGFDKIYHNNLE